MNDSAETLLHDALELFNTMPRYKTTFSTSVLKHTDGKRLLDSYEVAARISRFLKAKKTLPVTVALKQTIQ